MSVTAVAVTEFMVLVTGLRATAAQLTYRADLGIVRRSTDQPAADCYYCSGLWGSAQSRVPADWSRVEKRTGPGRLIALARRPSGSGGSGR